MQVGSKYGIRTAESWFRVGRQCGRPACLALVWPVSASALSSSAQLRQPRRSPIFGIALLVSQASVPLTVCGTQICEPRLMMSNKLVLGSKSKSAQTHTYNNYTVMSYEHVNRILMHPGDVPHFKGRRDAGAEGRGRQLAKGARSRWQGFAAGKSEQIVALRCVALRCGRRTGAGTR